MKIAGEVARITLDRFDPDAQRPVVIEGAIADWPALARWSPEYVSSLIGDVAIKYKVSPTSAHPNFHAATLPEMFATVAGTFRDLFGLAAESGRAIFTGDEKFVLRRRDGVTTIDPDLAPLLADVRVPLPAAENLYTVWAWFSGPGARTWLHYDNNGCHNLNAQITGSKSCVLFAPDELEKLALFPADGSNPAKNCSQIDVAAPDLARFPAFGAASAVSARLEAGDLLFIPAWWLHAFEHHGAFNSNINFWWKPAVPVENAVSRHQAALTP